MSLIYVINHFTRLETLLMPYHIFKLTGIPVWSLADDGLFKGALGRFLEKVGALSTQNPHRDLLMVQSLLTGRASWIIFPEGRMVKSRKIFHRGRFVVSSGSGTHLPHTGAAALALRTEFYRQRLRRMAESFPEEADRLHRLFEIPEGAAARDDSIAIVPVNLTYYPLRARENVISQLTARLVENLPERYLEELMTEGSMLLSGVDVDIRFGHPIPVAPYLDHPAIQADIRARRPVDFNDPLPSIERMRRAAGKIMQRYMAAIYRMTTVNHDHLFASMLRAVPHRRIDTRDLRRRVFLAGDWDLAAAGIHCHRSLEKDQMHLLVDDCFGKYRDFLVVAEEKGVLRRQGEGMVKDPRKLVSQSDFHRMRIDNPVLVIANEVEPLVDLERRIRRLAWTPGWLIRRRIVARLVERDRAEFVADYAAFAVPGESKSPEVGRSFWVRGRRRDLGVVLIHGYMAAPREVEALARYLGRHGIPVYAPRLRGHGTSPEDLAGRSYQDWRASADRAYGIVSHLCRRVVVGGFSTGAGLALDLAIRISGLAGVFAIAPPLRLQDPSARFAPAVDVWNRLAGKIRMDGAKMEFVENRPENPHINYLRNPIAGIREIERLMEQVEDHLSEIRIPALVAQADRDPVVDPKGSRRIFERIGAIDKSYSLLRFNRHGILLGEGAERVHRLVFDFVSGLRG